MIFRRFAETILPAKRKKKAVKATQDRIKN